MSEPGRQLKVFLCHSHSDRAVVKALYDRLVKDGVDAWLDKEKLLPGQSWKIEIQRAVREADVVIVCHSNDFNQAGFRQSEVKWALDTAMEKPKGEIFVIPARLEECEVLENLREWQWVDLFEDDGYEMLVRALRVRAENIGAAWQTKRSWIPKISHPVVKGEGLETEDNSEISRKNAEEKAEQGKKVFRGEVPKVASKPAGHFQKPKTEFLIALVGIVAMVLAIAILLGSSPVSRWLGQAPSPEPGTISTKSGQVMPLADSPVPLLPSETTSPTPAPGNLVLSSPLVLVSEAIDSKGVQMVLVPEGEFSMGSDDGNADEKPVHQVFLDAYYIDKYEVTNALYKQCVEAGVCDPPRLTEKFSDTTYQEHPVSNVRWEMAKEYCEWRGARLPTEAEWERAARGIDERAYPWGNVFDGNIVNFCDSNCIEDWADKESNDGYLASSPVGSYPDGVSPFGAYDMAGNVYEWVADWYDENYYGNSPARNPLGPENGEHRVMRGGSYYDHYYNERSVRRLGEIPMDFYNNIGFRCARSFTPALQETPLPAPEGTILPANVIDPKGAEMVLVPEGEFTMGSDEGELHEQPAHRVFIDAYYIDKYEVTNALYKACVDAGVCDYPTRTVIYGNSLYAEHPVVYVDWNMAGKYCEWRDARLPTEAEWEKAARGTDGRIYPWGDGIDCTYANYDNCVEGTTLVGSYDSGKSPYGSYDMAGNVWEWVEDFYSFDYYSAYPGNQWPSNPTGPATGEVRILRGGSWINTGEYLRSSYRDKSVPTGSSYNWGFRCARSP